ncbi:Transmembrane protein [Melia azedarach]|uniref:Transmembrane protein n=1 Tax=Melia azedarach TaxID=155640 RepID=A0ACC1WXH6_MELAZ|nr:Transmembrane protein [Melia azedarach]
MEKLVLVSPSPAKVLLPLPRFPSFIYVAWAYTSRAWRKHTKIHGVLTRSVSVGVLHGGKLALERLIDYHQARADEKSLQATEIELKDLLRQEHPDFKKLQRTVARLEMSGKDAEAVGILSKALEEAQNESKQHEAYEIEMLLAEMLIYKGDFEKALQCKCLDEESISDARRPLYKAIIHILLGHPTEAVPYWEQFNDIRGDFQWPPGLQDSQVYEVIENFDKFKNVVELLKHDIQEIKKKKQPK